MITFKKLLPKIAAVLLFLFIVAAMILYNEGIYDFTFISRDHGIVSVDGTTAADDTAEDSDTDTNDDDIDGIGDIDDTIGISDTIGIDTIGIDTNDINAIEEIDTIITEDSSGT